MIYASHFTAVEFIIFAADDDDYAALIFRSDISFSFSSSPDDRASGGWLASFSGTGRREQLHIEAAHLFFILRLTAYFS